MNVRRSCLATVMAATFGLFAPLPPARAAVPLGINDAARMTPAGSFVVSVWDRGAWREVGAIPADRFLREGTLDLGRAAEPGAPVRLKIARRGGGAAHLDRVSLGGTAPAGSERAETGILAGADLDMAELAEEMILDFPSGRADSVLRLTGRIEQEKISTRAFHYPPGEPEVERGRAYSIARGAGRSERPLFTELSLPVSGHPAAPVSGWAWVEEERIRARLDFTTDNTLDGDLDWASLRLATPEGPREFRVTASDRRWGRADFVTTDAAPYRHKVYEFDVPIEAAGLAGDAAGRIALAFSAYGTSSPGTYRGSVVYDTVNNRHLLAYQEFLGWPTAQLWVRLLGPGGEALGEPRLIIEGAIPNPAFAAFDPIHQRYLLAWTQDRSPGLSDVKAVLLDVEGQPLGSPFVVSDAGKARNPLVLAFDPLGQRYLVAWSDYRDTPPDIYGQLVGWNGELASPAAVNIPLVVGGQTWRTISDLVHDTVHNRFLLVWRSAPAGEADVHGKIFGADWSALGEEIVISSASSLQESARGAFDPVRRRFLVAWSDWRAGMTDLNVYGQYLDDRGRLLQTSAGEGLALCTEPGDQSGPAVGFDGRAGRFLVIWSDERNPLNVDVFGRFLDPELGPKPEFTLVGGAAHEGGAKSSYNSRCGNFLVAFNTQSGTVYDIGLTTLGEPCPAASRRVKMVEPNGGEIVPTGSFLPVHWGGPRAAKRFRLRYSTNGGLTWRGIRGVKRGSGFLWRAPLLAGNRRRGLLEVAGYDRSGSEIGRDRTDRRFTFEVVQVTAPSAGVGLAPGAAVEIVWRTGQTRLPVDQTSIFYRRAPGAPWQRIADLPGDPGRHVWTVPDVGEGSDRVALRIVLSGPAPARTRLGSVVATGFVIQP